MTLFQDVVKPCLPCEFVGRTFTELGVHPEVFACSSAKRRKGKVWKLLLLWAPSWSLSQSQWVRSSTRVQGEGSNVTVCAVIAWQWKDKWCLRQSALPAVLGVQWLMVFLADAHFGEKHSASMSFCFKVKHFWDQFSWTSQGLGVIVKQLL